MQWIYGVMWVKFFIIIIIIIIILAYYISVKSIRIYLFHPWVIVMYIIYCYTALLYPSLSISWALPYTTMYINVIVSL